MEKTEKMELQKFNEELEAEMEARRTAFAEEQY